MLSIVTDPKSKQAVSPMVSLYKYCFVLLFSISFLCENAFAFTANQVSLEKGNSTGTHAVVYCHHNAGGIPIDFPFYAEPDGMEDSETESGTDTGCDLHSFSLDYNRASLLKTESTKSSLVNFVSLIQKRETISLIVLHHSWKNHLA